MNGTTKIAIAKVSQSKSKGKAFVKELNDALSPEAIVKAKPESAEKSKQK